MGLRSFLARGTHAYAPGEGAGRRVARPSLHRQALLVVTTVVALALASVALLERFQGWQRMALFALVWAAAWWAVWHWLRGLLATLHDMERVAEDVAQRRYRRITRLPGAPELRRFAIAFNRLVDAMQRQLSDEEMRAERFRREALRDALTGLLNRRALMLRLAEVHHEDEGWLGLLECRGIEALNQREGYVAGDELICAVAADVAAIFPDAAIARLGALSFAVLVPGGRADEVEGMTLALFARIGARVGPDGAIHPAMGWTPLLRRPGHVAMAAVDLALQRARLQVGRRCCIDEVPPLASGPHGAQAWARVLRDAVLAGRLRLLTQPVLCIDRLPGEVLHREVFAHVLDAQGNEIVAERWWPMASRCGLLGEVDARVIMMLATLPADRAQPPLAVNLGYASWAEGDVAARLAGWRQYLHGYAVLFELREADAVRNPDAAATFTRLARLQGFGVGIDRFGIADAGLRLLRELLPDYVKLDASLAAGIGHDAGRFLVESLVRSAHSLDVPVLAQVFGDDDAIVELARLGVQGAQGYALGLPERLGDSETGGPAGG